MINWLQKQGGYTANGKESFYYSIGLTIEEKNELERLRHEIKRYRELEGFNQDDNKSENSDNVIMFT
jgi:hypothetical protein